MPARLTEYRTKKKESITGGTFNAINGGTCAIYSQDSTGFITGGIFSSDPSAYVAKGKFVIKNSEGKYEIVDSFSYGFNNPTEELAFCADCYNHPETDHSTHNKYLNIANGVAEVSRTGAWMAFENLDWDNKTYVLEYDIDLSDL